MAVFRGKDGVCAKKERRQQARLAQMVGSMAAGVPRDRVQTQPWEN